MSFEAAAWAIKQTPASAREKLILIVLADCHNDNTGQCDPSLQYLMKHALCARSTLVEALDNLEREGFLKRKRGDHKTRTQYKLNLVRLPDQSDNRTSTTTGLRVVRLPDQPSTATVPKPVNNQEETSKGEKFVLPGWIPKDLWREWMDIRKRKKAVNNPRALTALVNKLQKIQDAGISPDKAITVAIEESWKGIELEWLANKGLISKPDPDQQKRDLRREAENDAMARSKGYENWDALCKHQKIGRYAEG